MYFACSEPNSLVAGNLVNAFAPACISSGTSLYLLAVVPAIISKLGNSFLVCFIHQKYSFLGGPSLFSYIVVFIGFNG